MRSCWTGEVISHAGEFYSVDEVQVLPRPVKGNLEVWLGGIAPSEGGRHPGEVLECEGVVLCGRRGRIRHLV